MSTTVTVRRREGAPAITFAAAGPYEFHFIGPEPWTMEGVIWEALRANVGEYFEEVAPATDATTVTTTPARPARS